MGLDLSRRGLVGAAGVAAAASAFAGAASAQDAGGIKIVGVSCSLRKGKTTAAAVQACLDAAKAAGPNVEIELIDLAGMSIPVCQLVGQPIPEGHADDFPKVAEKLSDPRVAGIIIGTPVYFGTMTSLCKAFIERFMHFRRSKFALGGKVGGAVAVGGARHGGQERTLQDLHAAMLSQEMVVVGDGQPTAHTGATLWNNWKDDITQDEAGMATANNLGRRVAEVALRMSAGKR